ncbi:CAP-Gly domain-containing linker protein 1 isoform X2 [Hydra vulgaris]|uniref:Microtubule-associated tumor suppressor 1 n=1 Tax=Hydra vulgaris TaxID=6087 RepID=T2M3Y9_HYDVU|nr:CAP-Gly domain-containing linker protein 1 isoform X1 [Hydra vulgaris]
MTIESLLFSGNFEKTPVFAAKKSSTLDHGSTLSLSKTKFVQRLRNPRKHLQPEDIQIGDSITILYDKKRVSGTVRYIGKTEFSTGVWCGLEIEESNGKNNGTVNGYKYFECAENHGIFIRLHKVKIIPKYAESTPNVCANNLEDEISYSVDNINDDEEMFKLKSFSLRQPLDNKEKEFYRDSHFDTSLDSDALKEVSQPMSRNSNDSGIESPVRNSPVETSSPKNNNEILKKNYGNVIVSSYDTPSPKKAVFVGSFDELDEDKIKYQEEFLLNNKSQSTLSFDIPRVDSFDKEKLERFIERKFSVVNDDNHLNKKNSFVKQRCDSITSKIPIKVSTPKNDEIDSKYTIDLNLSNSEKSINSNDNSFPKDQKSISSKEPNPTTAVKSNQKTEKGSILSAKSYFYKPFSKPVVKKPKVGNLPKNEGENDNAVIVSNGNIQLQGEKESPLKCNSSGRQSTDFKNDKVSEKKEKINDKISDKKEKIPKSKIAIKKKSPDKKEKNVEELINNLQNQLKERNERINQLEVSLNKYQHLKQAGNESDLSAQVVTKNDIIAGLHDKIDSYKSITDKANLSFIGLSIVLQYYINQNEHIKKSLNESVAENHSLQKSSKEYENHKKEQDEKINDLKNILANEKVKAEKFQNSLLTLEADHETEILNLHNKYNDKISDLKTVHQEKIDKKVIAVSNEFHLQIEKLQQNNDEKVHQLKVSYKNQVDILKERETALKQKMIAYEKKFNDNDDIIAKQNFQIKSLEDKMAILKQENNSLLNRIAQITKEAEKDLAMQALILPYKQMPAELDSLKAVLELKTDELKSLRVKTMDLQRKVDQYYELQVKFDLINQENQSLKETLKKKAILERNISFERDALLEKFENEHRKVSRLSMENEELMWRASNSDLSYSSPNIFEAVEENQSSYLKNSSSFSTPNKSSGFSQNNISRRQRGSLYELSSFKK